LDFFRRLARTTTDEAVVCNSAETRCVRHGGAVSAKRLCAGWSGQTMEGVGVEQYNFAVRDADQLSTLQGPKNLVDGRTSNAQQCRKRFLWQRHLAVALFIEQDHRELLGKITSGKLQYAPVRLDEPKGDAGQPPSSQRRARPQQGLKVFIGQPKRMNRFDRPSRIGEGHAKNQIDVAIDIAWMHDCDDDPAAPLPVNQLDTTLTDYPDRTVEVPWKNSGAPVSRSTRSIRLRSSTMSASVNGAHSPRPTHRAIHAASCAMSAGGWRNKPRCLNPPLALRLYSLPLRGT
jgi:hypothetical protein